MDKLERQLLLVAKKRIGLMTHVVVGYPTLKDTLRLVKSMEKAGADVVELQIPFSDPLADGPTIMRANDVALARGVGVSDCFEVMRKTACKAEIPLVFMTYYNLVFNYEVEAFCKRAKTVGAAGLIVPDMPLDEEEHEGLTKACKKYGLYNVRLLSPTSTQERIEKNAKLARRMVYCTSQAGTTGVRKELNPNLDRFLKRVRKKIDLPLALGFGISRKEQVEALVGKVEIAVVGSAVIEVIEKEGVGGVEGFVRELLAGESTGS